MAITTSAHRHALLETMLSRYTGALLVVSHDAVFLDRLGLTRLLEAMPAGWRLRLL